jgi:hypothetical protein
MVSSCYSKAYRTPKQKLECGFLFLIHSFSIFIACSAW